MIALGYVMIVIPTFKEASEVLMQRNFHQANHIKALQDKINVFEFKIERIYEIMNKKVLKSSDAKNIKEMQRLEKELRAAKD